ncbi:MAG: hypothetical protein JXB07_08685 [Anaerolineae bacterium]|nr:hypothetical protein [Anaerolineae bacterium]
MPYSLELLLPEKPILIGTINVSFGLKDNLEPYLRELASILDDLDQPVYYIHDIRNLKVKDFQDFLVASSQTFQANIAVVRHPNLKPVVVSTDLLIKLAIKGINSDVFGNLDWPVFDTKEQALAHVHELIKNEHGMR